MTPIDLLILKFWAEVYTWLFGMLFIASLIGFAVCVVRLIALVYEVYRNKAMDSQAYITRRAGSESECPSSPTNSEGK